MAHDHELTEITPDVWEVLGNLGEGLEDLRAIIDKTHPEAFSILTNNLWAATGEPATSGMSTPQGFIASRYADPYSHTSDASRVAAYHIIIELDKLGISLTTKGN